MWFNGNDVYWYNPLVSENYNTYIKGTRSDNKITFEFPQQIVSTRLISRLVRTSEEGEKYAYAVQEGVPNVLTFSVAEDGTVTMDEGDITGTVIMGYTTNSGSWASEGIFNVTLTPFNKKLVEAPVGIELSSWVLSYKGVTRDVQAGFDGKDFYVLGMSERCPKAWLKGTLSDEGKVVFPSDVYVGLDPTLGYRMFMYGAVVEYIYNPSLGTDMASYVLLPEFVMDYDAETEVMTATSQMVVCPGEEFKDRPSFVGYENMTLRPKAEVTTFVPANPVITNVEIFPTLPNMGWDCLSVDLSNVNTEGQLLDTKNIYYRVLLDNEPYILDPEDFEDLDEPMEWIPFDFSCYDLEKTSQCGRDISIYISGPDIYSVQEKYVNGEDEYFSDIISVSLGAIDTLLGVEVVESYYTDLYGRRVSNPAAGIYLRHDVLSNGKTRVTKAAVK
ncbi:MAG: hypothetical protein K2M00_07135, partial [Muribaculaceae bacterium]|nr:hypothetical protein [Muribaculaceae bacterium]